jgi:hypothetical protein
VLKEEILYPLKLFLLLCALFDCSYDFTEVYVFVEALLEERLGIFSVVTEHRPVFHKNGLLDVRIFGLMNRINIFESLAHQDSIQEY